MPGSHGLGVRLLLLLLLLGAERAAARRNAGDGFAGAFGVVGKRSRVGIVEAWLAGEAAAASGVGGVEGWWDSGGVGGGGGGGGVDSLLLD